MSETTIQAALKMEEASARVADHYASRELALCKAVRETGTFHFLGEQVYCVNATTGLLTNGKPVPTEVADALLRAREGE